MRALLVLAATVAGSTACFTPIDGGACHGDSDCSGAVCTRIGECASETYALRVHWTVDGQTADTAGACNGIDELQLTISDPQIGEQYAVRPVPCGVGSFFYDKLPLGFTEVGITAYGAGGSWLANRFGSAVGANGDVTLDLEPLR